VIPIPPAPGGAAASADGFVAVLAQEELPRDSQRSIPLGFSRVLLCHTADGIFAVADLCPHALQPLAGAMIADGSIRCLKHGALFELASGKPQNGVTPHSLRVYPVRLRNGQIEIAPGTVQPRAS
jgi:nitrite reductase/ring-hydroxylating ferredoxin subunit